MRIAGCYPGAIILQLSDQAIHVPDPEGDRIPVVSAELDQIVGPVPVHSMSHEMQYNQQRSATTKFPRGIHIYTAMH